VYLGIPAANGLRFSHEFITGLIIMRRAKTQTRPSNYRVYRGITSWVYVYNLIYIRNQSTQTNRLASVSVI